MTAVTITPRGPFSLAASTRFLEGFTPASYDPAADRVLRLAFPADDGHATIAAEVRQDGPAGTVRAEFTVPHGPAPPTTAVRSQLARILSLDVDGSGFPQLAATDPVLAGLMADHPGLRPVCFHSPYEAAAWAVIGNRIRMTQAAAVKSRMAEEHGRRVRIAGRTLYAFPTPPVLATIPHFPGLTGVKIDRLHALAEAASAGELDATRLRAMPTADALAALRTLPGIGPFAAELVLIRGAGHPDVFPLHERRLHAAMTTAYHLTESESEATVPHLTEIANHWKPYRSWAGLLFRVAAGA